MKKHVLLLLPLAIVYFGRATAKEQIGVEDVAADMIYEPGLSFHMPPLTNSTFKHWHPKLTSVFHKNKLVLTPELKNVQGMVINNYVSGFN